MVREKIEGHVVGMVYYSDDLFDEEKSFYKSAVSKSYSTILRLSLGLEFTNSL
jgi:hypothetical protein